jgi:hypothetical protein
MHAPAYDIQGKILQANGSPLAGVTFQLNTGATLTTNGTGSFSFNDQLPGTYTLTPISPDLSYLPAERTVIAEDEILQIFYALPQPVVDTLSPNTVTQLSFNDTQGLPTTITFPEGLGEQQAVITPLLGEEPAGYQSAGHTFDIDLADAPASIQSGVVGQNGEPLSIEVEVQYSQADLQSVMAAEELILLWDGPDGWTDAQATCPAGNAADNNLATQTITVPVCQWGTYGLFAPIDKLFMPNLYGEN